MDPKTIARLRSVLREGGPALDAAALRPDLAPGDVVGEHFVVEGRLGAGGMGTVYRARDLRNATGCALKVAPSDAFFQPARFAREAELLAEVTHPAIVRYIAHGQDRGAHYLVMELLEGRSLAECLRDGALSLEATRTLGRHVARALGAAHAQGVIHRDLTPSNLFLQAGDVDRVKVCDFGLARRVRDPGTLTRAGSAMGTPGYMAPEQLLLGTKADARSDVFALGCVLFECLGGRPAFVGVDATAVLVKIVLGFSTLFEASVQLPRAVGSSLQRMLAPTAAQRPADGGAVAEEIERWQDDGAAVAERREPEDRVCVLIARGMRANVPALGDVSDEALAIVDALRRGPAAPARACHVLLDGAIVIAFDAPASERAWADSAARTALAIRAHRPSVPIAVAVGGRTRGGHLGTGGAVDRAARMLKGSTSARPARRRAEPAVQPVRIDADTASLLRPQFRVLDDPTGPLLFAAAR